MNSIAQSNNLGVVAVVPFWSQSDNLNCDSNYAYLRVVLPELSRQSPDTLFLMFFPDPNYGSDKWVYKPDGLQSERIRFIPWPYDTNMYNSIKGFDTQRFKQIDDVYAPTMYWLHQVEMGMHVYTGYESSYGLAGRPTTIAQHHYIIHESLPYPIDAHLFRLYMQQGGSIASDAVVYNTQHTQRMARESFSRMLNRASLDSLENKSQVLRFGLLTGDEPRCPSATQDTTPVFIYNHRFENYKQPTVTFGQFDALRMLGHKFEVHATQTVGQEIKHFRIDKSIFEAERADYLRRIAVPGINTINSVHETFCISILDSMAVGNIIVAPNGVTFPELLPAGYPYLFDSPKTQLAQLDYLLKNFEQEFNKWSPVLQEHARKNFALRKYASDYLQLMSNTENLHRQYNMKDTTQAAVDKVFAALERGKEYSPKELCKSMKRIMGIGGTQSFPTRRVVREAAQRSNLRIIWNNGVKIACQ